MAVDRGFEMPLAVSLTSMAEVHTAIPCHVSVMCSGVSDEDRRRIEHDVAGRLQLEWLTVSEQRLAGAHYTVGLSRAALFRILLPELLPPSQERTIYLDADTLVRRPLTELWRADLADSLLGAVRDAGSPFAAGPAGTDWRALHLDPSTDYFNSGMLVMALDRWRDEHTADATLDLLRSTASRWGDQDALNVVTAGRWRELPRRWNLQTPDADGESFSWALWPADVERAMADPVVIHYTTADKPWTGRDDHPFGRQWFDQLARTSWAGWRPGRGPVRRGLGRFGRAAHVLRHG
jgi:lipopolysaccharide biosynthesis glycosyltransferase